MNEIIAALQEEIAAAQKKRSPVFVKRPKSRKDDLEDARLFGYIQGLNQALYLLTKEPVKGLPY